MSAYYSKKIAERIYRFFAMIVIVSILCSLVPAAVFADNEPLPVEPAPTTQDGETASSTDDGTDGGDGDNQDGEDGDGETPDGGTSTTTATSTATTTPNQGPEGDEGTEGQEGQDGSEGTNGTAGATPDDEVDPVEIISDGLLGDTDAPEGEENTGDIQQSGLNREIITGIATAQGELATDANSNDIRSELESVIPTDYDTYTFTATGTNEAQVSNDALARSITGDNFLHGRGTGKIKTGDAVAVFNIANVINTNVINSDGFLYLANKILEEGQSLDLTSSFFPDEEELETLSDTCSLLSCVAEDVVYNSSQMNYATITNNALIEAETGFNETSGDQRLLNSDITTGDAYAAANVLNVVNSNIIDSNYRLLTYNAIGDLDGDLILPTGELFDKFFSRPNGINQVEDAEDVQMNIHNVNDAGVDNNVDAYAETGENASVVDYDAVIKTGRAESESNVLNKINENTYGGDSLYMLIRIHGSWDGEVVGLPEGLTWEWTPEGIVIYNVDAEIAPSEFLGYDQDSYTANFENNNRVALQNDITLNAVTGENKIDGLTGNLETGNAFASANVMNIANTNVIGTNWTMAIVNIMGDFEGNISFATTDIGVTGTVVASDASLGIGDTLTYTYTVTNHSNTTATNVVLNQTLQSAHTNSNGTTQSKSLGSLAPGQSKQGILTAIVNSNIPYGTTTVTALASVMSDQGDENVSDNSVSLSKNAFKAQPVVPPTPGGSGTTTATTTNPGGNGTTTTPGGENTPPPYSQANYYSQGTYSSGGGGGGGGGNPTPSKEKVARELKKVDPNTPPLLTIKKVAVNLKKNQEIKAGESVDYKITVSNAGGNAYDAEVFDVLVNPIGSVMNEQSWDLGTILPGEVIDLTYTTEYNGNTPSGKYTNTASVKAYLKDGMKEKKEAPLKVKDAVYIVEVEGVDLAIGNISVLAYFPGPNGKTSALVTWETSKPSLSEVFYGLAAQVSPYNAAATNLGYQNASFKFPNSKVKHAVIINGLDSGRTHAYRIHAISDKYEATSRELLFTIPAVVAKLTLAAPTSMVAGASINTPAPIVPAYVPPVVAPKPVVIAPVTVPAVVAKPNPLPAVGGFVNQVKNNLFNFFH